MLMYHIARKPVVRIGTPYQQERVQSAQTTGEFVAVHVPKIGSKGDLFIVLGQNNNVVGTFIRDEKGDYLPYPQ
jgi:hypothetical protein